MQEEHDPPTMPTDTLNEIGVLKRREIEARILAPLIEALSEEFGSQRVLPIVREVVGRIATEQGEALAKSINGRSLALPARLCANSVSNRIWSLPIRRWVSW
jgi:hypothetical protein